MTMRGTGRSPTSPTSEQNVRVAKGGMPWETGAADGKYRYHPGGDKNREPKDAPSAVNVVVVPDVNLPKVWGCSQTSQSVLFRD